MLLRFVLVWAIVASGFAYFFGYKTERLEEALLLEQMTRMACGVRVTNIVEDLRSDQEIDNLPPDALLDVPPHWLLPAPDGGS